jgi:hypothetical protein
MLRKVGITVGSLVMAVMAIAMCAPIAVAADLPGSAVPTSAGDSAAAPPVPSTSDPAQAGPAPTDVASPPSQESPPSQDVAPTEAPPVAQAADSTTPPPAQVSQGIAEPPSPSPTQIAQGPAISVSNPPDVAPMSAKVPLAADPPAIDAAAGPIAHPSAQPASQLIPGGNDGGDPPSGSPAGMGAAMDTSGNAASPLHSGGFPIPVVAPEPPTAGGASSAIAAPSALIPTLGITSFAPALSGPTSTPQLSRDSGAEKGPTSPRAPPGGSGLGGPASSGFSSFGLAGLLIAALALAAIALGRRLEGALARCRPVPFLSLLERPG